ncbi:SlyX family protein [Pelagibius sp. 7325]|uniref:SlyX family protein n=2 Tax=Pseudomonadati TaxID=3379134 RepID=UPI0030ECC693
MNATTKTLEKIEADVAYGEKALNDLSEMVIAQGREIDKLKAEVAVLGRQISQIAEGEAGSR